MESREIEARKYAFPLPFLKTKLRLKSILSKTPQGLFRLNNVGKAEDLS